MTATGDENGQCEWENRSMPTHPRGLFWSLQLAELPIFYTQFWKMQRMQGPIFHIQACLSKTCHSSTQDPHHPDPQDSSLSPSLLLPPADHLPRLTSVRSSLVQTCPIS